MKKRLPPLVSALLIAAALGGAALAQGRGAELVIAGDRVFPESITSTRDGALFTGSLGGGGVMRAAPGAATATAWIAPGRDGLLDTFGVLADEPRGLLWVCSSRPQSETPAEPALYAFGLQDGALRGRYPLPGGTGLCNDIAIGPDGGAYVADTRGGRLLRLKAGAAALEVWAEGPLLAGADGLAFLGSRLFVNSFTSGKLLRIDLQADGRAGPVTEVATSRPFEQPDGMRPLGENRLLMAEGAGRIDLLTVDGDRVDVRVLREGLMGPVAVTVTGGTAWALEGKLSLRRTPEVPAAPFKAYAVALP